MDDESRFSYVLPLRWSEDLGREELTHYLTWLTIYCHDVIVVDGSPSTVFAANASAFGHLVRHVVPDPSARGKMRKVPGVLTGVGLAVNEAIVIADDDVRYDRASLVRAVGMLHDADLVRPQNYFDPLPWHASWDTARTLLNRSLGADFPGTLVIRRSTLLQAGGYDGDVLFENLELIRTIRAVGGRVEAPLDLFVRRLPPTARHFLEQRVRQAYEDFGIPLRMACWLLTLPALALAQRRRLLPAFAVSVALLAEIGRRRSGGQTVFSPISSALAPGWLLERSVCAWLAVFLRLRRGGMPYRDSVIPIAANSTRRLRRRHGCSTVKST